jgi:hypothetical protein
MQSAMPNLTPLQAGPVSLLLDEATGTIRQLSVAGQEIVRSVYFAIRDEDWSTVAAAIKVEHRSVAADSFDIVLTGQSTDPRFHYGWRLALQGSASGEILVSVEGVAASAFLRNRIGLCVLHPILEGAFAFQQGAAAWLAAEFPAMEIAPYPVCSDVTALRYAVGGTAVSLEFFGDAFEMEDQRNWGDHSYKTYVTPQHRPKPVAVKPGDSVQHSVRLRFAAAGDLASCQTSGRPRTAQTPLRVGLLANAVPSLLDAAILSPLAALGLDHLRVDLRLSQQQWRSQLEIASQATATLGISLHLACYLGPDQAGDLEKLRAASAGLPVSLFLIHEERNPRTADALGRLARNVLGPHVGLAVGTDAFFCEMNRTPAPPDADWLVCFPFHPQAHLTDDATIMDNIPALGDALTCLLRRNARPAVVSPVTLGERFPADAWFGGRLHEWMAFAPDPRQETAFGAAWLDLLLADLRTTAGLHSITLFPTHGPGGVLDATGQPRPAYKVLEKHLASVDKQPSESRF